MTESIRATDAEKTTEDLVAEYPEGREGELLPAAEDPEGIEPYEGATPVPIGDQAPGGPESGGDR